MQIVLVFEAPEWTSRIAEREAVDRIEKELEFIDNVTGYRLVEIRRDRRPRPEPLAGPLPPMSQEMVEDFNGLKGAWAPK